MRLMVSIHSLMKLKIVVNLMWMSRSFRLSYVRHVGKRKKDQRELDLEGLPEKKISHPLTDEQLDAHYGSGNWRRLPDDTYARLRFTLASWTVERHSAAVAVGKSGDHQDEFLRGDPPQ